MKVYVAASSLNWGLARGMMKHVIAAGHEITYDWTQDVEKFGGDDPRKVPHEVMLRAATNDRQGVIDCDLFILMWSDLCFGAIVETGMALALHKQVWIIGDSEEIRFNVFWYLPEVRFVYGWEIVQELEHAA